LKPLERKWQSAMQVDMPLALAIGWPPAVAVLTRAEAPARRAPRSCHWRSRASGPAVSALLLGAWWPRRVPTSGDRRDRGGLRHYLLCRCAPKGSDAHREGLVVDGSSETPEEAIRRLNHEISEAIESDDAGRAAQAQRELGKIHLDKPSVACRHLIREDCFSASAMLRLGDNVPIRARVFAVKKLSRWLRWPQATKKDLVPVATALAGLLCALQSEPEVAWAAQCALFHIVRCTVDQIQNVRDATRGKVTRLLLDGNTQFPFCLPELTERAAEAYEQALRNYTVRYFFTQLQALTLIDPGYGDSWETYDLALLGGFAKQLGRSLHSLQSLKVLGFEDCALKLILPHLWMPRLRNLHILGSCQQKQSQRAILTLLQQNGQQLEELELNLCTEFLHEAPDPFSIIEPLPKVKRLTVRAPILAPWDHFGKKCPSLEELTFVYDQDFALNLAQVLEDIESLEEEEEFLGQHTTYVYKDAARFAMRLHALGFRCLAETCPNLKVIRFSLWDNSFGTDTPAPSEEQPLTVSWRRSDNPSKLRTRPFGRCCAANNATRSELKDRAEVPLDPERFDSTEEIREITEEEAMAASAKVMLQVVRWFDDPSLEAELGLHL